MEIGNNTSTFGYNVDYFSRANAQQQAVSNKQGVEQDTRGVEKNETSTESKNNQQQTNTKDETQLTNEQRAELSDLRATDSKVRAHEAAHQSGAAASGGASFTYTKGPDGVMYAVAGEVPVRVEEGTTPQETILNSQSVIATALAPADPSPQDISIASKARVMLMKAQQEFAQEIQDKISNSDEYSQNAKNSYEENSNSESKEEPSDITA